MTRVHEALEFLAILRLAQVVDEFGEFAMRLFALVTLGFEPIELGGFPFVERGGVGRRAVEGVVLAPRPA
jgi:hypothetical protein